MRILTKLKQLPNWQVRNLHAYCRRWRRVTGIAPYQRYIKWVAQFGNHERSYRNLILTTTDAFDLVDIKITPPEATKILLCIIEKFLFLCLKQLKRLDDTDFGKFNYTLLKDEDCVTKIRETYSRTRTVYSYLEAARLLWEMLNGNQSGNHRLQ